MEPEENGRMKLARVLAVTLTIALAAPLISPGARAQQDTNSANYIMLGCEAFLLDPIPTSRLLVAGVCAGIIDTLQAIKPNICLPAISTRRLLVRGVATYINNNPARLHENFIDLAGEALEQTWPCKP
jgi:hypothetical protein